MDKKTFWDNSMGELTLMAAEALFDFDDRNEMDRNKYMQMPENFVSFSQGLWDFVKRKYNNVDETGLLDFIVKCGKSRNVELPMNTIKNWVSKDKNKSRNPQANPNSRDNMYKLCFALDFDAEETAAFFSNVYLSRPFDCRKMKEAIYLFCLNNGLSYTKAQELLKEVEEKCIDDEIDDVFTETKLLNMQIKDIHSESDFLSFMTSNRGSFTKKNTTAITYYERLLKEAKILAGVSTNEGLLELIYDMKLTELREHESGELTIKKEAQFLEVVKRNFPQKEQLHQIEKGKAEYDTIRKALILIKFYVFFMNVGDNNSEEDFEDFCLETDDMLNECGYALLYPRNPYDWIFMHCAACSHDSNIDVLLYQPLDELKNILVDMICFEDETIFTDDATSYVNVEVK